VNPLVGQYLGQIGSECMHRLREPVLFFERLIAKKLVWKATSARHSRCH